MVFQAFNHFPHLSIIENCCLEPTKVLGLSQKVVKERAMVELVRLGIAEQAYKYSAALSGGQQQRTVICRSLCIRPRVMLFNEPTSALDSVASRVLKDVMFELVEEGVTIIIVSHEMCFARRFADRIVMMEHGRIPHEPAAKTLFR